MNLTNELRRIFEENHQHLPEYAWASEADRWAELVFCLLQQSRKRESEPTRQAVDMLSGIGLLHVEVLAGLSGANAVTFRHILKRHGYSDAEATRGMAVLKSVAGAVRKKYAGKIQRVLRKHGERMRNELVATFRGSGLKEGEVNFAVSQWLQNTLSIPISLEHEAVKQFCKANKITLRRLLEEADRADVNVALVDDLLDMQNVNHRLKRSKVSP